MTATTRTLPQINRRYQLVATLGTGGMGAVYQALDRLTGAEVALKRVDLPLELLQFMTRSSTAPHNLQRALADEFKFLASLRHPHIISVMDYGFDAQRQPFFTMELLNRAQSLLEAGTRQPLEQQIGLIVQILQALTYLHRRRVIHRDLKPENVQVVGGQVKLLDFGLAVNQSYQMAEHAAGGTLFYIAPEVLNDQAASEASDLYAVGVLACEVLTGSYPFDVAGKDLDSILDILIRQPPDLTHLSGNTALQSVVARLLAKRPEDRYSSAHDVTLALCDAVGQPAPAETTPIRESFIQAATFVGRERELGALQNALSKSIDGQSSAWLVGGESGVGKSRLLDELQTHALIAGALVLRGQAVEGNGLPYQLWRNPLRRLAIETELTDMEAGVLREVISDIDVLIGRAMGDVPELPGAAGQQRLALTIVDLFLRVTTPVVLLIEDLHWAMESLEPLRLISQQMSNLPLLLVASYRDEERPALPTELPDMQVLSLARLDDSSISALSEAMLGEPGKQAPVIDLLKQETEGNVFFMVEVVRALAEEVGSLSDIGRTTLHRHILTGGLQHLLQRRLSRVPAWGSTLLKLAAVTGRQINLELLDKLKNDVDLQPWLLVCADAAVLEVSDNSWRFVHDKLRESLLKELHTDEGLILHQQVAEAIEAIYPGDDAYTEALADHWDAAGKQDRALPYLVRAVQRMAEVTAEFERAEQWIARGLAYGDSPRRAALLRLSGYVAAQKGDYDTASDHYRASLAVPNIDAREEVEILNGLSVAAWRRSEYVQAGAYAQDALKIAAATENERGQARSLQNLGGIAFGRGDYAAAQKRYEDSAEAWRSGGNQFGLANCLNNLAVCVQNLGDIRAALDYFEKSLELFRMSGATSRISTVLGNLGALLLDFDNDPRTQSYLEESLNLARRIGDKNAIVITLNNLARLLIDQHNFALARTYLEESLVVAERVGNVSHGADALCALGELELAHGDIPSALPYFDKALSVFRIIGEQRNIAWALADIILAQVRLNQLEAARSTLSEQIAVVNHLNAKPIIVVSALSAVTLAHAEGKDEAAVSWLEVVESMGLGYIWQKPSFSQLVRDLQAALGDARYAAARERGKTLTADTILQAMAIELGLTVHKSVGPAP